ncbi:MAG: benzoate-CoA ligase family protein [Rhodospirillaceae bacterium]|nr:benzoate-CoA ligase family protein [Rhodospirillaceae bacterium]
MQPHEVRIAADGAPIIADRFNAAVPFIDRHLAEGRGAKPAIRTTEGETVTYAALAERVNRCGNALKGLGIAPGDRMLMVVKDCPAFFYAFWGAIKAGTVPVPLNTLLRAKDYEYMIADSGCTAVIHSPEFAGEIEPALAALATKPRHVLPTEGGDGTLDRLMAAASGTLEPHTAAPDDDCFWLYSSGSTGRPKGAVHRQRDMVVTSERYGVQTLGARDSDVFFSAAKLFFAYGLGNAMTFPLWVGGTAILLAARPTPDSTFDAIAKFRPTLYFGVPTLYAAQLAALDKGTADLSSIRYCASAGEALPADIFRRWKAKTGLTILDGWGSTEALHIAVSNTPADQQPGKSGWPVPGYAARIVGEDGRPVRRGEPGALHIKGDSTARTYWNQPERSAATMLADGWLNTGDTYFQDEAGTYVYAGRNDDMLKVGGIWTSPVEIEGRLIEHAKVLEAAIVGRADADGLIKPEAWIVLKEPAADPAALEADLREHCKKGLAPYKYPRWFKFVDELPKTATGKIQRFKLRA